MFCDLPNDIQSLIAGKLNVFDRARLRIAFPKLNSHSKHIERHLGVLARAVKRSYIKKATPAIISFVDSVAKNDPTLQEILSSIMPPTRASTVEEMISIVRNASPEELKQHLERFRDLTKKNEKELLFNIMLYNTKLFDYVCTNRLLDIELVRDSAFYCCYSIENINTMHRHFSFTRQELERMYIHCIESMYIDSAEHICRLKKQI